VEVVKLKSEKTIGNEVRDTVTPEPESTTDVSFVPSANDTPRKLALKRKIQEIGDMNEKKKHHTHSISENYDLQLIKEVILKYIDLRLRYACKQMSAKDSIRNYFKKIVLFKGE